MRYTLSMDEKQKSLGGRLIGVNEMNEVMVVMVGIVLAGVCSALLAVGFFFIDSTMDRVAYHMAFLKGWGR